MAADVSAWILIRSVRNSETNLKWFPKALIVEGACSFTSESKTIESATILSSLESVTSIVTPFSSNSGRIAFNRFNKSCNLALMSTSSQVRRSGATLLARHNSSWTLLIPGAAIGRSFTPNVSKEQVNFRFISWASSARSLMRETAF